MQRCLSVIEPALAAPPPSGCRGSVEWSIGAVFLVCTGAFLLLGTGTDIPLEPTPAVAPEAIATDPLRRSLGDPPIIQQGANAYSCQECHALFESSDTPAGVEARFQHQDIDLDHGRNDHCYNCHDQSNRNLLRLHGGKTTTFDQSSLLCAQCHGTTHRDWQQGMHGKTMGSWRNEDPRQRRLACVECHDPHSPAFDPFRPLPGPRTLRMGEPVHHQVEHRSPLMQWHNSLQQDHDSATDADHGHSKQEHGR